MGEDRQREIAGEGGRAAHASGTAHEFDTEETRKAGKKGGEAVSEDREHMSDIGRKGGESGQGSRPSRSTDGTESQSGQDEHTRGGSPEQHAKAGQQSHKND